MAKVKETPKQEQEQAPQPRPCPQDCRMCGMSQQIFCSTKMLFDLSRSQQTLREQVDELAKAVGDLQDRLQPKEQDGELSIPFSE